MVVNATNCSITEPISCATACRVFAVCVPAIPWLFATFKDSRWDTEIGNLSYPIYLSHLLIVVAYWTVFHGHNGTVEALIAIAHPNFRDELARAAPC